MTMMEIYNEAVYDLLGSPKDSRQSPPGGHAKTSLDIRQNAAGGTSVPGLTEVRSTPRVFDLGMLSFDLFGLRSQVLVCPHS